MKWLKYVGVVLCVLLIVGTIPSVYYIALGLISERVDEPAYFLAKLLAYVGIVIVLLVVSAKLLMSARRD